MNKIKIGRVIMGIVTLGAFLTPTSSPVWAQRGEYNKKSGQTEVMLPQLGKSTDNKFDEWMGKHLKKPIIAGITLGAKRSEITNLLTSKQIAPLQRTAPMDIFPRLIGEISYIQKAYLFYTEDRLSKLSIVFDVPVDSKGLTGEPLFQFYTELRKKLIHDYGQPTNSTAYVHPNFPYTLVALETGNAFNLDYWENVEDMKILLSLKGREEKIDFSLTYQYLYFESELYLKAVRGN